MAGKVAGTVYGSLLNLILSLTLPAPAVATRRKETSCFFGLVIPNAEPSVVSTTMQTQDGLKLSLCRSEQKTQAGPVPRTTTV